MIRNTLKLFYQFYYTMKIFQSVIGIYVYSVNNYRSFTLLMQLIVLQLLFFTDLPVFLLWSLVLFSSTF
jgi:hypothetical protein